MSLVDGLEIDGQGHINGNSFISCFNRFYNTVAQFRQTLDPIMQQAVGIVPDTSGSDAACTLSREIERNVNRELSVFLSGIKSMEFGSEDVGFDNFLNGFTRYYPKPDAIPSSISLYSIFILDSDLSFLYRITMASLVSGVFVCDDVNLVVKKVNLLCSAYFVKAISSGDVYMALTIAEAAASFSRRIIYKYGSDNLDKENDKKQRHYRRHVSILILSLAFARWARKVTRLLRS